MLSRMRNRCAALPVAALLPRVSGNACLRCTTACRGFLSCAWLLSSVTVGAEFKCHHMASAVSWGTCLTFSPLRVQTLKSRHHSHDQCSPVLQRAQQDLQAMAAEFHARYRRYALLTPPAWLQAIDGGAVRQVRASTVVDRKCKDLCAQHHPTGGGLRQGQRLESWQRSVSKPVNHYMLTSVEGFGPGPAPKLSAFSLHILLPVPLSNPALRSMWL